VPAVAIKVFEDRQNGARKIPGVLAAFMQTQNRKFLYLPPVTSGTGRAKTCFFNRQYHYTIALK